ncbi:hypothetical protein R1sor_015218 [Riccia sorocarpa]|uniref:Uncharacterized protein n=1 Tax=Riccia sorocarpa TaxID=122646 RepID=A0ABD3HHU4_9MARC
MGGASSACKSTRVIDQSYLYIYNVADPTAYTSFSALPDRSTSPDVMYGLVQLGTQEPDLRRREPGRLGSLLEEILAAGRIGAICREQNEMSQSNHIQSSEASAVASSSRPKMTLRSLLEQDEEDSGCEELREEEVRHNGVNRVCCVCMLKKKGAAFIPCGHTFCSKIHSVLKIY